MLAKSSDVFNDKIVEAILASNDLDKLFETKKMARSIDIVIDNAVTAIIAEIKGTVLEEMDLIQQPTIQRSKYQLRW